MIRDDTMKYSAPGGLFQKGFTLSEILVTLSISALLISAAIPDFTGLLMRNRAASLTNSLLTSLLLARSEAIKKNREVTLCKSTDSLACNGNWSDGWIIFSDVDGDRRLDSADGDQLLAVEHDTGVSFNITWNGFRSDNYIQFSPLGSIHSNNGTFILCPPGKDNHYARAVVVNRLGRARASRDNDSDGIHEDGYGNPIDCR